MTIYSGFTHEKWWFSIVMLNYQRVSGFKHAEFLGELWSPTSIVAVRRCTWCGMLRRKKIAVQLCATAASAEVTGQNIHPVERRKGRGWMTMLSYLYCNWKVVRAMVERVEDQLVYTQAILKQPSIRIVLPRAAGDSRSDANETIPYATCPRSRAGTWRVARRVCLKNAVPKANTHGKPFGLCDRINV